MNFLDVRFYLDTETYQTCRKPDSNPVYTHKNSNHPATVLKQIPKSIAQISYLKKMFLLSNILNEEVLEKSNHIFHYNFETK